MVLICSCLVFSSSGSRGHSLSGAPVKHYNHYLRTTYGLTQYNCQILLSQSTFVGSTPMQIRLCKHLGVMQCSGKILCTLNLFFFFKSSYIAHIILCSYNFAVKKRGKNNIVWSRNATVALGDVSGMQQKSNIHMLVEATGGIMSDRATPLFAASLLSITSRLCSSFP